MKPSEELVNATYDRLENIKRRGGEWFTLASFAMALVGAAPSGELKGLMEGTTDASTDAGARKVRASDITDDRVYAIIEGRRKDLETGVNRWAIAEDLPYFPPKVVLAKLYCMVRKGKLDGCACGCRGDFIIPRKHRK